MPLPGGSSDKIGNRFELWWTAFCLVDLLDERAEQITIEPPGVLGDGVEFVLVRNGVREYHQVKRQISRGSGWTISRLRSDGVLSRMAEKLKAHGTEFHFVSTIGTREIDEFGQNCRQTSDFPTFRSGFLTSTERLADWKGLIDAWNPVQEPQCYELLKRIHVETISEDLLRNMVVARISPLVEGDARNIANELVTFALDSVNLTIFLHALWRHIERLGYRRRAWGNDPRVLAAVAAQNTRFFTSHRREFFRDQLIEQPLVADIQSCLGREETKRILLSGEAGGGKSCLLIGLIEKLQVAAIPHLALRLDRLEAASTTAHLGDQIGLPGSPVSVLGALSQGRTCVLIIDQLDAVSLISGKNPDLFDTVYSLLEESMAFPSMGIVAACRGFDLDNDHRLKKLLTSRQFAREDLGPLSADDVLRVVAELGFDPNLTGEQLRLLSNPLHLSMLANLKPERVPQPVAYGTATELFDAFWERKRMQCQQRGVSASQFQSTIDLLCEALENRGSLFAPEVMLDQVSDVAAKLASEHVLSFTNYQWSFSHEGFYDFANARRLLRSGIGVADYLQAKGQGLELRTQLRQSLVYRRMRDFAQYLKDLEKVLSGPTVRFHLKIAAVAFLKNLPGPTEQESAVITNLVDANREGKLAKALLDLIGSSRDWYRLSVISGAATRWHGSHDQEFLDLMVWVLVAARRHSPDLVAALLQELWNTDDEWRARTTIILSYGSLSESREVFKLFLGALKQGLFDQTGPARGREIWSLLDEVSERRPDWTCEAVGVMLRRAWQIARAQGHHDPFAGQVGVFGEGAGDQITIARAYQSAPLRFLREVWSTFVDIAQSNLLAEGDPPFSDLIWRWHLPDSSYSFRGKLIDGIDVGIRELARVNFRCFVQLARSAELNNSVTIDHLLLCGFAAAASAHPDEAISCLLEETARLRVGWRDDPERPARELIQLASTTCSQELLRELETLLLSHYTDWERGLSGRATFGRSQFALLSGIEAPCRSPEVVKRLQELERKFHPYVPPPASGVRGGFVSSPIPERATSLMTDEQWLAAFERYTTDDFQIMPDGSTAGGAGSLAIQLGSEVKKTPLRFLQLVFKMPKSADPRYFDQILTGLSGSSVPVEQLVAACQAADELPGNPCGMGICYCLGSFASGKLPSTAVELVGSYCGDSVHEYTRKSALLNLANIFLANRAKIADAIGCLRALPDRVPKSILPELCYCLTPLLGTPFQKDSVQLFLKIWGADPWLPADRLVEYFLLYAARLEYSSIKPVLEVLLTSDDAETRLMAARSVTGAALFDCEARELVKKIAEGDKQHRQALAQVCAANMIRGGFSNFCGTHLSALFDDEEAEVREAASECFRYFSGEHLAEYQELVARFLESRAAEAVGTRLLHALGHSTIRHSSATLDICEKVVKRASSATAASSQPDLQEAKDLVLRTYHQAADSATRERSLGLIDEMLSLQVYGLEDAILAMESRR